jgi:hypothetical protein
MDGKRLPHNLSFEFTWCCDGLRAMRYLLDMPSNQPSGNEASALSPVLGYAGLSPPPIFAVVWCRLFALWMFANGLSNAAGIFGVFAPVVFRIRFQASEVLAEVILSIVPMLIYFLVAWYCWSKAPVLARRMVAGLDYGSSQHGIGSDELLQIVLMGIGVYLLTEGIPGVARLVFYAIMSPRNGSPGIAQIDANIFSSIFRCGLGAWLILGTRGIGRLLRRHSGRWRDESETRNPKSD